MAGNNVPHCELCNGGEAAVVFCPSDSAYLCFQCDSKVHEANVIVARHLRCTICPRCGHLDANRRTIPPPPPQRSLCRTCSTSDHRENSVSTTSSSLSSPATESSTPDQKNQNLSGVSVRSRRQDRAAPEEVEASLARAEKRLKLKSRSPSTAEEVLVNWCRRMGVDCDSVVPVAVDVIRSTRGRFMFPVLPSRLALAASFWLGWRLAAGGDRVKPTCWNLKRVEEVTGTPGKLILAAESRFVTALRGRKRQNLEEGWAES